MPNYMQILGDHYPDVEAYCVGNPTVYSNITWKNTVISQAALDAVSGDLNQDALVVIDATTLDTGKVPQWTGTKWVPVVLDGNGTNTTFGTQYAYAETESAQSTTSPQFIEHTSLTTNVLSNGTYRVGWYSEIASNSSNSSVEANININNAIIGNIQVEPADTTNWYVFSGFRQLVLSDVQTIKLEFKRQGANATVSMRRSRIEILRLN